MFGPRAGLRFLTAGVEILGSAGVPVVTCVIAGTLGKSLLRNWGTLTSTLLKLRQLGRPAAGHVEADNVDALVGSVVPADDLEKLPVCVLLSICFIRLIVVGAVQFMATTVAFRFLLPKGVDPLMKLALLIQCCRYVRKAI